MTINLVISDEILLRAQDMRARGLSWAAVGRELRVSEHQLRKRLEPAYAERHREAGRSRYRSIQSGVVIVNSIVPPDVEEERSRALSCSERTLTAEFCGDPLPGRSALDRRGEG